jgi:hypothetical protein
VQTRTARPPGMYAAKPGLAGSNPFPAAVLDLSEQLREPGPGPRAVARTGRQAAARARSSPRPGPCSRSSMKRLTRSTTSAPIRRISSSPGSNGERSRSSSPDARACLEEDAATAGVASAPGPARRRCESAAGCAERRQRSRWGCGAAGRRGRFERHALWGRSCQTSESRPDGAVGGGSTKWSDPTASRVRDPGAS